MRATYIVIGIFALTCIIVTICVITLKLNDLKRSLSKLSYYTVELTKTVRLVEDGRNAITTYIDNCQGVLVNAFENVRDSIRKVNLSLN